MTQPRIELLSPRKLVGKQLEMSFANDLTPQLWRSFMPVRNKIRNAITPNLFSVQLFGPSFSFYPINPHEPFTKWATLEVTEVSEIPDDMDILELPGGLYAIFPYRGTPSGFALIFNFIFNEWLPNSGYELDQRPHFELLGEKYKNNDPTSEEDIYIPVREKK